MLFDDKLLFIHTPKCAGMAVTEFLIANSPHHLTLTAPEGHATSGGKVSVVEGRRHETLLQAEKFFSKKGRSLDDFDVILSILRNPYELEVSYYHYKRLGHPWDAGKAQDLALEGDFARFARTAPFYGRLPARIEDWYELRGKMPGNIRLLRFENLESELRSVAASLYPVSHNLKCINATRHAPYKKFLNRETEEAIYRKYQWLFDRNYYPRENV